jgi:GNAT superfamily N-acetyltransferase
MRCIGVNQWAGGEPWLAEAAHDLEQQASRARKAEQDRWQRRAPSDKFFQLAQERFKAAKLYGIAPVQNYWQIGDWTLAEINRMYLEDAADSSKFLVHLQSLYVVDAARGQGEGKRALEQIKQLAEECGCGVTLFAKSFAFGMDGERPNAVQTMQELVQAALEQVWPVIYQPDWDAECLRFFYQSSGLQNLCLYGPWVYGRPKEHDLPFDRHFAYLPRSMDPQWISQIENRLNPDLCPFCNR